jgi:LSD1 subclass zinc finger protein
MAENQVSSAASEKRPDIAVAVALSVGGSRQLFKEDNLGFSTTSHGYVSAHEIQFSIDLSPSRLGSPIARQEAMVHSVCSSPTASLSYSPGGWSVRCSVYPSSLRGTGAFLEGQYSQAEVLAFGGVPTASIRLSKRIKKQPNAQRLLSLSEHKGSHSSGIRLWIQIIF